VKPFDPGKVKLFCGILYSDAGMLEEAIQLLEETYGAEDYRSGDYAFDETAYYEPEMGGPIKRMFVSFEPLILPNAIAKIKIQTNEIEEKVAVDEKRKVNLDPGYLDYDKVVLASAKYNGNKVYLDHGIWADLTLHYEKGRFDPYPWSFPDFRARLYDEVFLRIREIYKKQMKVTKVS
jgi:hypothetical protein